MIDAVQDDAGSEEAGKAALKKNFYGEVAHDWWRKLNNPDDVKSSSYGRAVMARLRRCGAPSDAYAIDAAQLLYVRLNRHSLKGWEKEMWLNRVGILAITLGYVKSHKHFHGGLMVPVGREKLDDQESAKLSEGRFRRLLQVREPDEMLAAFRRLVRYMPEEVDVKQLAPTILNWGDKKRRDLAFSYYGAYRGLSGLSSDS